MSTYILHRLLLFIPTLFGASILIFVLMRLVPGDIAEILVYQTGSESGSPRRTGTSFFSPSPPASGGEGRVRGSSNRRPEA